MDTAERNIAHAESVEKELDNFIRNCAQKRRESEGARLEREMWVEISEREDAKDVVSDDCERVFFDFDVFFESLPPAMQERDITIEEGLAPFPD